MSASEIITNQMRLFLPLSFIVLCRRITRSLFLYKVSLSTLHTTTEYERDLPSTVPPQVTGVVTTHTVSISVSHQTESFLCLAVSLVPEHSRVAGQQHVAGVGVAAAAVLRAGPRDGRHGDQDGRHLHRPPAPRLALGWGHGDTS